MKKRNVESTNNKSLRIEPPKRTMMPPIIDSALLKKYSGVRFGMSTRVGGISPAPYGMNMSYNVGDREDFVETNRRLFFEQMGIHSHQVATMGQVHGSAVLEVNRPGKYEACDALLTASPNLFLGVSVADCLPIILYDPVTSSLAAIHSGWKGSVQQICRVAVGMLHSRYGVKPENIISYVGPSAGVCCYEVGEEVAGRFPESFLSRRNGSNPRLDLKGFNRSLLLSEGILEEHIEISPMCTICFPSLLHSYRREGKLSGRMIALIGILPQPAVTPSPP